MSRPGRMLWMDADVVMSDGTRRRMRVGRGDDRNTYLSLEWLGLAERFVVYVEGEDVVGPGGDYVSTRVIRRRFPRFRENRRFLLRMESMVRRTAIERGWHR